MSKLSTLKMYLHRPQRLEQPTDLYDNKVTLLDGGELDLANWRGKPTLFVNTASKCGFTPQYEGLQSLYERYHDRGLNILGSPSGDFADQEFDEASEIGTFCQENYGVEFPLTERTSVREQPDPLWRDLTSQPEVGAAEVELHQVPGGRRRAAARPLGLDRKARGREDHQRDRARARRRRVRPSRVTGRQAVAASPTHQRLLRWSPRSPGTAYAHTRCTARAARSPAAW